MPAKMPAKDWAVRHRQLLRQLGTQRRKLKRLEEEAESLQSKEKLLKTLVAAREEEIKFFARAQNVGDSAADSGDAGWSPPSDVWVSYRGPGWLLRLLIKLSFNLS